MGADTPRAILLGMLKRERGLDAEAIAKLADGSKYAAEKLSADERKRLETAMSIERAPSLTSPATIREWLDPYFERTFGEAARRRGRRLASRAPLDLRVKYFEGQTVKAVRRRCPISSLSRCDGRPGACGFGLSADAKSPAIHAEPAFIKGLVEVQDEGVATGRDVFRCQTWRTGASIFAPAPAARRWRWPP